MSDAPRPLALVTGGSAGLGLELAHRFAARGHDVIITARGAERVARVAQEHGYTGIVADVGTQAGREAVLAAVRERGRLDVLVNNAGGGGGTSGVDVDATRAAAVLEANFYAHVELTRELWPLLREAKGGVIVISSGLGTYASAGSPTYGASKAALTSWARALRVAGRREGVRVLAANPGPVSTDSFPHEALLADRFKKHLVISVERCVSDIMRAYDRNRSEVWSRGAFRLLAIAQGVAPNTFDRHLVP